MFIYMFAAFWRNKVEYITINKIFILNKYNYIIATLLEYVLYYYIYIDITVAALNKLIH